MAVFGNISAFSSVLGATLGAPGDTYIVTDLRKRSRKEPNEVKSLKSFDWKIDKKAPEPTPAIKNGYPIKPLKLTKVTFNNPFVVSYNLYFDDNGNAYVYFGIINTEFVTDILENGFLIRTYNEFFNPFGSILLRPSEYPAIKYLFKTPYYNLSFDINNNKPLTCNISAIDWYNFNIYNLSEYLKNLKDNEDNKRKIETINYLLRKYQSFINDIKTYSNKKTESAPDTLGQFSLGRTASDEIYNNNDLMQCKGMKPTYQILPSYDYFFEEPEAGSTFAGFGLRDTKKLIRDYCRKYWRDCAKIAQHLKGDTLLQSCFNLWHWMRMNIRYEYDREGREEVRSPRRVWADRKHGVDCDCLSVFAWCVLKCMGYNPAFELVAFRNKPDFSHIFINCDGVIVDRVWFIFNALPPGVTKSEIYKVDLLEENLGKIL